MPRSGRDRGWLSRLASALQAFLVMCAIIVVMLGFVVLGMLLGGFALDHHGW